MSRKREITVGEVKLIRNPKKGTILYVKSPSIEKLFRMESAAQYGGEARTALLPPGHQCKTYYKLTHLADIGNFVSIEYSDTAHITGGYYFFLRSPELARGIEIPLAGPMSKETAKNLVASIQGKMKYLYSTFFCSYVLEAKVSFSLDRLEG